MKKFRTAERTTQGAGTKKRRSRNSMACCRGQAISVTDNPRFAPHLLLVGSLSSPSSLRLPLFAFLSSPSSLRLPRLPRVPLPAFSPRLPLLLAFLPRFLCFFSFFFLLAYPSHPVRFPLLFSLHHLPTDHPAPPPLTVFSVVVPTSRFPV